MTAKSKLIANTDVCLDLDAEEDDDDSETMALSDGEDTVDAAAHGKLLASIQSLDGKKKKTNVIRGVSLTPNTLDLAVHANRDKSKVTPKDLNIKQTHVKTELNKPLSSGELETAKRKIARSSMVEEACKWDPVVREFRQAPQVHYAQRDHGIQMYENLKPKQFTPRSALEKELYAALGKSQDIMHPDRELTVAEERALKAMSISEAKARRAELMKHHELLSRMELKAKRLKRIKSKKYRKILRREKEAEDKKELENLQKTDPDAFIERMEMLEQARREERLTLKHSRGKFSRLHKAYSKFDDKTRNAIQEMLQKSKELTKKRQDSSSEDEDEDDPQQRQDNLAAAADAETTRQQEVTRTQQEQLKSISKKARGWLDGPAKLNSHLKSDTNLKVESSTKTDATTTSGSPGEVNSKTQFVYTASQEKPKSSDTNPEECLSSDDENTKENVEKESNKTLREPSDSLFAMDETEKMEITNPKKKKRKVTTGSVSENNEEEESKLDKSCGKDVNQNKNDSDSLFGRDEVEKKSLKSKKEGKKRKVSGSVVGEKEELTEEQNQALEKLMAELEKDSEEEGEEKAAEEPKKKKRKRNRKKKKSEDTNEEQSKTDGGTHKVKEVTLQTLGDDQEDSDTQDMEGTEQDGGDLKVSMEELFQDEDFLEEFAKDKEEMEERSRPKVSDLKLPGWGDWAGPDYKDVERNKQKNKPAKRAVKKKKPQQPFVWLNPKRDEHIRKLQPKKVPFPYTSVQQYEASVRQPVSRGLVPEACTKLLTKPEIVTKLGHIIKPMDKEDYFGQKKEVTAEENDKNFGVSLDERSKINKNKGKRNKRRSLK